MWYEFWHWFLNESPFVIAFLFFLVMLSVGFKVIGKFFHVFVTLWYAVSLYEWLMNVEALRKLDAGVRALPLPEGVRYQLLLTWFTIKRNTGPFLAAWFLLWWSDWNPMCDIQCRGNSWWKGPNSWKLTREPRPQEIPWELVDDYLEEK